MLGASGAGKTNAIQLGCDKMTVASIRRTKGYAKNFKLLRLTINLLLLATGLLLLATELLKIAVE